MAEEISFEEFSKVDLRVGKVVEAEDVPGSRKLLRLVVDLGELGKRQILSGIKKWYRPEELVGKNVIVVANLKPKKMAGLVSEGMILLADLEERPVFLVPEEDVPPGTKVR